MPESARDNDPASLIDIAGFAAFDELIEGVGAGAARNPDGIVPSLHALAATIRMTNNTLRTPTRTPSPKTTSLTIVVIFASSSSSVKGAGFVLAASVCA